MCLTVHIGRGAGGPAIRSIMQDRSWSLKTSGQIRAVHRLELVLLLLDLHGRRLRRRSRGRRRVDGVGSPRHRADAVALMAPQFDFHTGARPSGRTCRPHRSRSGRSSSRARRSRCAACTTFITPLLVPSRHVCSIKPRTQRLQEYQKHKPPPACSWIENKSSLFPRATDGRVSSPPPCVAFVLLQLPGLRRAVP